MDKPADDPYWFWPRVGLWATFAVWGFVLIRMNYRTGEIGAFFAPATVGLSRSGACAVQAFWEWMTVFGGTLGQLLMPAILSFALLRQPRRLRRILRPVANGGLPFGRGALCVRRAIPN